MGLMPLPSWWLKRQAEADVVSAASNGILGANYEMSSTMGALPTKGHLNATFQMRMLNLLTLFRGGGKARPVFERVWKWPLLSRFSCCR